MTQENYRRYWCSHNRLGNDRGLLPGLERYLRLGAAAVGIVMGVKTFLYYYYESIANSEAGR